MLRSARKEIFRFGKVSSVQEACAKCFAVCNLENHMKKQNKTNANAKFVVEKLKTKAPMFFVSFFSSALEDFKF